MQGLGGIYMHETLCDRDMKDLNDLKRVLVNSDLRYLKIDQISYPIWGNCPEGLGIWTPFPLPKLQGKSRATFTFRAGGGRMAPMAETITEKRKAHGGEHVARNLRHANSNETRKF